LTGAKINRKETDIFVLQRDREICQPGSKKIQLEIVNYYVNLKTRIGIEEYGCDYRILSEEEIDGFEKQLQNSGFSNSGFQEGRIKKIQSPQRLKDLEKVISILNLLDDMSKAAKEENKLKRRAREGLEEQILKTMVGIRKEKGI